MNLQPVSISAASTPLTSSDDNSSAAGAALSKSLSKADFLKLLVAQMTAQDPLNPQSNTEFAAQMAQFSALQASQSTQLQVTQLKASQQVQQANDLIGRVVRLQTPAGGQVQGLVNGVVMNGGVPNLLVNGAWYDLGQVLGITAAPTAAGPSSTAPAKTPVDSSTTRS